MGRKRFFAYILAAGVFLTAGCSKKADKVKLMDEMQSESGEVTKAEDDFAQFRDEETWVDEIRGTYRGQDVGISVKADILVPETTQSMAVEVKMPVLNEEYRESVLKGAFADEDIYYYDMAHWTTEGIQKAIESCEFYEDEEHAEGVERDFLEENKEELKKLRKYLKDSKDEYTKADVYDVNEYIARRDGIWYVLSFSQEEGNLDIFFSQMDDGFLQKPEGLWEHASYTVEHTYPLDEGIRNLCKLSPEEAKKEIVSFAEKMGISNLTFVGEQGLGCQPVYDEKAAEWEEKEYDGAVVGIGYVFSLATGISGEVCFGAKDYYFRDAFVTNEGVIRFSIRNPVELERVTEHVSLLPLDKIKEAFLTELSENLDAHCDRERKWFQFDSLELVYLRQMKDRRSNEGTYLPVWALKDDEVRIYVNAIDGTVIPEEDIQ